MKIYCTSFLFLLFLISNTCCMEIEYGEIPNQSTRIPAIQAELDLIKKLPMPAAKHTPREDIETIQEILNNRMEFCYKNITYLSFLQNRNMHIILDEELKMMYVNSAYKKMLLSQTQRDKSTQAASLLALCNTWKITKYDKSLTRTINARRATILVFHPTITSSNYGIVDETQDFIPERAEPSHVMIDTPYVDKAKHSQPSQETKMSLSFLLN